ncbi:MAG: hypothetical protein ACRDRD_19660, partial [Pseudonocardiaceae bacterium]
MNAIERDEWLIVFNEQREVWRRAYLGLPPLTSAEAALSAITPPVTGDLDGDGLEARRCVQCGEPIGPDRPDPRSRYCDLACRRAAELCTRRLARRGVAHA